MKKMLAMLLAIIMIFSTVPMSVLAVENPTVAITVGTEGTIAHPGDSISVPVVITRNDGLTGFTLGVEYDTTRLEVDTEKTLYTDGGLVSGIVYAENASYMGQADFTATGTLFTLNFKVKADAPRGDAAVTVKIIGSAEDAFYNVDLAPVTLELTSNVVAVEYETAGLSFVNGSQSMDYEAAKADAEGDNTLTKPGDDYHFVGWFSGLADTYKDANGYYVIEPTATVTGIAGTELRPRYQTPPTEGTYNALWIKGTGSYAVNVGASSLDVYVGDTDSAVLSTAIAAANGARTKLVKDMNLGSTKVTPSVSMNLDMNGYDILAGGNRIISPAASTSGNVIESSRDGAEFRSNSSSAKSQYIYGTSSISVQFDRIRDVDFIGAQNSQAIYLASATKIENCNFEGYIQFVGAAGTTVMDSCTVTSSSFLIIGVQKDAVVTITNSTMNSTGTNPLFVGNADTPGSTYGVGSVVLGAGNSVVATSATAMFRYLNPAKFVDTTSNYQIKVGGTLTNVLNGVDAKVECSDTSLTAIVDGTGKVVFGDPCTVTYTKDDGSIETKTGLKGGNADLSFTYQIANGKEYKLLGWSTDPNATEPMTEIPLSGDITLYAVKARKGVMIGTDNNDYESGNVTTTYKHGNNANAFTVYNADRLDELDGLTLLGSSSYIKLVFSAEALDAIASQVNGESKDISVVLYRSTSGLSDGAKVKGQIALTYKASNEAAEQAITIPEGVEVQLRVNSQSNIGNNKKLAAYDVANPDTELATESKIVSSYYWAYFRMPANGTFEVKALSNAYVGEDQMVGNQSFTLKNGDTDLVIEKADKIGELTSLLVSNDFDGIDVRFTAAALDDIAAKVTTERVIIRVAPGTPSEGAAARAELSVIDGNGNPVDFSGAVEVSIKFTREADKNYRAYYIPENGDPVALFTTLEAINAAYNNWKAIFTTTHFSTFEVRETEIANGYTAVLDITETAVRAGGKSVNVAIDVTHSDKTQYNAGEIKVKYDAALLTFNETDSTLPGKTTCKTENGELVIEFYGSEIEMPHKMNLVFTTCESVDSEATTVIELTGAAFADSAEAKKEDLIGATIEVAADSVTIKLEELPVEKNDEIVLGEETVVKGTEYTFTVAQPDDYNYDELKVTVDGTDITDKLVKGEDGTYTIPAEYVTGEIVITDNRTPNKYKVTINYTGDDADTDQEQEATYGVSFSFTIPTMTGYQYTLREIIINGTAFTGYTTEGNIVTIPGAEIKGEIAITIEKDDTLFNVSVDGNGAGDASVADQNGETSYDKGDSVILTITPATGYKNYTVTATMATVDVTEQLVKTEAEGKITYTLANIDGDIVFNVTKEVVGTITITEYLTLDADETDNTSLGMFLVCYTDETLTDDDTTNDYIPMCNNEAMYWSDNYGAYCYLVINTDLAAAQEAVKISAGTTGTNTEIEYTINVNCSANENGDAADAQLVYDMYMAMYKNFDDEDVTMLKFLLADTNNDKVVDSLDAEKIIATILNLEEVTQ